MIASLPARPPIAILGVRFDNVTSREAVERIETMIASGRPHYVATANVDFVARSQADGDLRRILFEAPLVLCDGTPLLWASRWLGNRLVERVAGSDLVPSLLQVAEEKGYRVFFLGGQKHVTERAAANVAADFPKLQIAGQFSPDYAPLDQMDHEAICRKVRAGKPDLLFVSFGCPKQEKWIARHYRRLGVPVCIGVGATIDFLAGSMQRAPKWMQRSGLEWLFRLMQEPRRLAARYGGDAWRFGPGFARQWFGLRRTQAVSNRGRYTSWVRSVESGAAVDLSNAASFDSADIGMLMWLAQQARESGAAMALGPCSRQMEEALQLMLLDQEWPRTEAIQPAPAKS